MNNLNRHAISVQFYHPSAYHLPDLLDLCYTQFFLFGNIYEDSRSIPAATIQRFFRVHLKRRRAAALQKSMLAFTMGVHPRLGLESKVATLEEDILTVIYGML